MWSAFCLRVPLLSIEDNVIWYLKAGIEERETTAVARQRLGKNEYTCNNRKIVGRGVFFAVSVVSKKSRRLVVPSTSFLCFCCPS
jgi:hypothetical protein